MKSQNEILKSLGLNKSTLNIEIAKNYLNVLKVIQELKNEITEAKIIDLIYIEPKIDYRGYLNEGRKMNSEFKELKTLEIKTDFSCYHFTVPTETDFYYYICVLLKIQAAAKKVESLPIENTIYIDSAINESILKASKFTGENYKNVVLNFENNLCQVFATNGYYIYKSSQFDFTTDKKIENLTLSIPMESINTNKNEFLKIDLIDKETIYLNDNLVKLSTQNASGIVNFSFDASGTMEFSKVDLQKGLKSIKPLLNKHTKAVEFHLNGSIQMQPMGNDSKVSIDYLSKDFEDTDLTLNFDYLTKILSSYKSKNLSLTPSFNKVVITDKTDIFVLMQIAKLKNYK